MSYADHLTYDEEATIQEADILQAQYEEESRAAAAQRAKGICLHSGSQGWPDMSRMKTADAYFIGLAQEQYERGVPFPDGCRCTEGCGRIFASDEEHRAEAYS
jgi:hypothetical protein